jgi:hypothetical protein
MKKYLLIEHSYVLENKPAAIAILLDTSDIKIYKHFEILGRVVIASGRFAESMVSSEKYAQDYGRIMVESGEDKYIIMHDFPGLKSSIIEFPDDDSAKLWFMLEYGGM